MYCILCSPELGDHKQVTASLETLTRLHAMDNINLKTDCISFLLWLLGSSVAKLEPSFRNCTLMDFLPSFLYLRLYSFNSAFSDFIGIWGHSR